MKTKFLPLVIFGLLFLLGVTLPDAYAGCAATILPQPCFDSFMGSTEPMTEKSIMEDFARNVELNYPNWKMSDRNWDSFNENFLEFPLIICTEFVADGITQYRMAQWVDAYKISSFENHRNDWLCNKWLPPVDDGIKIKWDKPSYLPDDVGTIQVIDKDMNNDNRKIDSFDVHVWSDIDHQGIQLVMTEIGQDSGIFEGTVYFTTVDESSGKRLLVEDAVHSNHKKNYDFSRIIYEPKLTDEQICEEGHSLVDGICMPNSIWDSSDFRGLQTGETIANHEVAIILESLGAGLIVFFIVVFAVKKRRKK